MKKRVLTGSRTSGSPHLGNYFGAFKPAIELGKKFDLYFFLADFHSLDDVPTKEKLREDSLDLAATMLACGLNPKESHLFMQSAVPQVTELAWMLSCVAPYGMMLRSVAFKDAQAKGNEVNMGIFNYPILMAADILLYDAELVPVGKDQKQHLEMARSFAQKFNQKYKEDIFVVPEPLISEEVGLIPGCDGEKMSKSKNNVVSVFATDKKWKKQIMGIKTSSEGLDDPKNPETCNVFQMYKLLASSDELELMADKYRKGGYGFGHAKLDLLSKVIETFSPMREVYQDWISRPDDLRDVLLAGSVPVREKAILKLNTLHEKLGLLGRPF
jgi:tryptophanyl-tRNA synthetase